MFDGMSLKTARDSLLSLLRTCINWFTPTSEPNKPNGGTLAPRKAKRNLCESLQKSSLSSLALFILFCLWTFLLQLAAQTSSS